MATVEKLRAALAEELPGILKTVVAAAKDGDVAACRLILDRILPPLKAAEAPVVVEEIGGGSRSSQGEAILLAMADGVLSPSQAAQLIGALAAQAKIVEVDELERRLTKLEESIGRDNGTH